MVCGIRSFNAPLVFSGEPHCYPDSSLQLLYDPVVNPVVDPNSNITSSGSGPLRFLNSGSFVGWVGALRQVLPRLDQDMPLEDDQRIFTKYMLEHPGDICLDTQGLLFQVCEACKGDHPSSSFFLLLPPSSSVGGTHIFASSSLLREMINHM